MPKIYRAHNVLFDAEGNLDTRALRYVLEEFKIYQGDLMSYEDFYNGEHEILKRTKVSPMACNEKIVTNHAKFLTDIATSYVGGKPVIWSQAIDLWTDIMTKAEEDIQNFQSLQNMGVYGKTVELLYVDAELIEGSVVPVPVTLSPLTAFVVYDTDIKNTPVLGVIIAEVRDYKNDLEYYTITAYTDERCIVFHVRDDFAGELVELVSEEPHLFGRVPMYEAYNNDEATPDSWCVRSLIEAYNAVMSDSVNALAANVESLLILINTGLGETPEEIRDSVRSIRENRILELSTHGNGSDEDVKYLQNVISQTDVNILGDKLTDMIHKISMIPDLTDTDFIGSAASGIALKYRLIGIESIAVRKERAFKKLLRTRLELSNRILELKGKGMNTATVSIMMERNLPTDAAEKLNQFVQTEGSLSQKTRLMLFNPDLDVDAEIAALNKENEAKTKQTAEVYGDYGFSQNSFNTETKTEEEEA